MKTKKGQINPFSLLIILISIIGLAVVMPILVIGRDAILTSTAGSPTDQGIAYLIIPVIIIVFIIVVLLYSRQQEEPI